ncbi:hypothetical protein GCM10007938_06350 [Vibrio zhanjiangensis]|uniref:Uncharacterized protein n=1 Tax=Vibrio zhanjiangensis TaxID=1046128 RepID=A0ABQ6EUL1_9VIBR|nr:hypothetical protein GCM10007938_06350 [Vibrio zhanjiangensis]
MTLIISTNINVKDITIWDSAFTSIKARIDDLDKLLAQGVNLIGKIPGHRNRKSSTSNDS